MAVWKRYNGKRIVHEMYIMSLLGHTTLQMTSRYKHAMPENLRTAVDMLGQTNLKQGRAIQAKERSWIVRPIRYRGR